MDYSEIMDDFTDRTLLANILRARDNAPLNFSDLSAITGAFSLTSSLTGSVPFGPLSGTPNSYQYSVSPTFGGTSSPVLTLGTLNTQGFIMTMIQPISTTYVLSKWDTYPHELLLYLFVKAIRLPYEYDNATDSSLRRVHRNDPDSPADLDDFKKLVNALVDDGNVDMKSLLILDPLGDPVPICRTIQATTPTPSQPGGGSATGGNAAPTTPGNPLLSVDPLTGANATTYFVRVT